MKMPEDELRSKGIDVVESDQGLKKVSITFATYADDWDIEQTIVELTRGATSAFRIKAKVDRQSTTWYSSSR